MKTLIITALSLVLLSARSKESGSSSKSGKVKVTNPISDRDRNATGPNLPDQYAELRKTNLIDPKMYACLLNPKRPPALTMAGNSNVDGTSKSAFEINFNQKFIEQVVDSILAKKQTDKISPDFFWGSLDTKLANILNDYLVERYMNMPVEKFNMLRSLIAYGMIYFMENQDYNTGLSIEYGENLTLKLAFAVGAQEMEHIRVCNMQELKDYVVMPNDLKDTSYIVGALHCSKDGQSVKLKVLRTKQLIIELKNQNRNFILELPKSEIDKNDDSVEIEAEGNDLEIEVVLKKKVESSTRKGLLGRIFGDDYSHNYFPNDYSGVELEIDSESLEFDETLACTTIKKFVVGEY